MAKDDASAESTFEQRITELEKLVEQLESGDLELAESLERFKHGVELSRQCRAMLDEAQQVVEQIMESGNGAGDDPAEGDGSAPDQSGETSD